MAAIISPHDEAWLFLCGLHKLVCSHHVGYEGATITLQTFIEDNLCGFANRIVELMNKDKNAPIL